MQVMRKDFTPVFLTRQIREIEQAVLDSPAAPPLMLHAGTAVAELAREMLGDRGKRILVLAGPGNNGGDAFIAARQLKDWWFEVIVVCAGNPDKQPADAKAAGLAWRETGGTTLESVPEAARYDLIIDGLFGIGLERPLENQMADLVDQVNASGVDVLSIDIPSGLHADSGRILGRAIRARRTLTFIGMKAGLLTLDGPDCAGSLQLDTLGIDLPEFESPRGQRIETSLIASVLPARMRNSHKGTFGNVGLLGGAPGMVGAALLAGRAALKLGAGRVYAGLFAESPTVDLLQPELMLRSAQDVLKVDALDCLAAGPGLGESQAAQHALAAAIAHRAPLVLDADALNLLAVHLNLQQAVAGRTSATILTPHPAEAARLLGTTTEKIQQDRIASACTLAQHYNASVVLKGNGSICALASGDWYVNTSGNPGMAAAGMGDVLTGIIAALIAQGGEPRLSLLAGVHLHGLAADRLVAAGIGPAGLTASEVIDAARATLNQLTA